MAISDMVATTTLSQRLGYRLREIRKERGLTQRALAGLLQVDHSRVSRFENRAGEPFTVAQLEDIAAALRCDLVVELRPR